MSTHGTTRGHPRAFLVWIGRAALLVAIVGGWSALAASSGYWTRSLSTPTSVASQLGDWLSDSAFHRHVGITLLEAVLGYALGIAMALILVLIVACSRFLDSLLSPFITVLTVIPYLALAPMFMVWFGLTLQARVYFVATAIFIIIFYAIYSGLRTIDQQTLDNQRVLGASRWRLIREIYVPSTFAWVMSSLRLSAAWAILAAVISEYLGSTEGLGYVISQAEAFLDSTTVLGGILVVAGMALIFDRVLVRVERRYSAWKVA